MKLAAFRIYAVFAALPFLTGCWNAFRPLSEQHLNQPSEISEPTPFEDPSPPSDQFDENCAVGERYDACLVFKNKSVSQKPFGVRLRGLLDPSRLENEFFSVEVFGGEALHLPIVSSDVHELEQIFAYYWLFRLYEYWSSYAEFKEVIEPKLKANGKIKVRLKEGVNGVQFLSRTIHVEEDSLVSQSAEILAYYMARLWVSDEAKGIDELYSGVAEYLVYALFPHSPSVGDLYEPKCALARSFDSLVQVSFSQVQSLCAGEWSIYTMGAFYASFWWEARRRAELHQPGAYKKVDAMLIKHISMLKSVQSFSDIEQIIKSLDQSDFNSQLSQHFNFQRPVQ